MRIALERICSVAAYGVKISVEANNRVKIFFLIIIEQKLKLREREREREEPWHEIKNPLSSPVCCS
jgi:hypothetical protein